MSIPGPQILLGPHALLGPMPYFIFCLRTKLAQNFFRAKSKKKGLHSNLVRIFPQNQVKSKKMSSLKFAQKMVRSKNLTRQPELFRAP